MQAPAALQVHACAILLGAKAVLIRGRSGSGKSSLALALLNDPRPFGFARLVGDDRIDLNACAGHVVASVPPPIAGLAEMHGAGILRLPSEPLAAVGLVVDLVVTAHQRLPEPIHYACDVLGLQLPHLALQCFDPSATVKIKQALAVIYRGEMLANGFCAEAEAATA